MKTQHSDAVDVYKQATFLVLVHRQETCPTGTSSNRGSLKDGNIQSHSMKNKIPQRLPNTKQKRMNKKSSTTHKRKRKPLVILCSNKIHRQQERKYLATRELMDQKDLSRTKTLP